MPQAILISSIVLFCWMIRRDTILRSGLSGSLWIPTLWMAVIGSRPISAWVGYGAVDTLDGSPVDRLFYLSMIVAAAVVLSRRQVRLAEILVKNWPITLFYGYLLISVLWANSPTSSFKRWFKEVGNIAVILVLLTESNPLQSIRAVFVRCAYVLIPLSVILIRYFPEIGRTYNIHSGVMEATGVTFQKNSLGAMLLVCTLVLFWDWLERGRAERPARSIVDRLIPLSIMGMALWLLLLCDSKTSILCLVIGGFIISSVRLPILHRRIKALGIYFLVGGVLLFLLDRAFGFSQQLVSSLGRDMTFTGRTEVWRELLAVKTDFLVGTGFMSFWDDMHYREMLPKWVAYSAHSGYLEVYLAGGVIGVAFLALMLLATGKRINSALGSGGHYAVVRFAIFVVTLIANFSESNFACMSPVGFLFLLAAIGHAGTRSADQAAEWSHGYRREYRQMPAFHA